MLLNFDFLPEATVLVSVTSMNQVLDAIEFL